MEFLFSILDSPRLEPTEVILFILLIAIVIANRYDGHRVYLAITLFAIKLLDLIIRPFLPWDIIVFQSAFLILNLAAVILIVYRVTVVSWLRKVTSLSFTIFNNDNTAKEQIVIAYIWGLTGILCLAMIIEHLVRHPYLIGLPPDWAIKTQIIYDIYTPVVTALTYLLILILFIMTIDGWAIRKMRAMEETSNAKKRLD
ncbi:hypothetical protein L1D59_07320 [Pseudoalteromonas piscicida]|uniref:hypothetical protein n=1 Tax=Pseudoalteromonas piscicida TaxID=43662 RepID=UPI001EFC6D60|nr:hypothetical protein [Pseudoalteromonas piscicida]MCG9768416.1 hypothetical protein [Pseudoalteromonas piscicida]